MENSSAVFKNALILGTLILLFLSGIDATMGQTFQIERFQNDEIEICAEGENTLSIFAEAETISGIEQDPFYLIPLADSRHGAISKPDDSFCHSTWWFYYRKEIPPNAATYLPIEYNPDDSPGIRFVSEDAKKLYYELFHKNRNDIRIPNHVKYNIALRSLDQSNKENKRSTLISNPATRSMWKDVDSILRMFVSKSSRSRHRPK